ncbi:MAG: hypothetical protein FOGNACKC_01201 [Anaerolineae bacterium]|nr:hypothetical protein [Anaerolineae bacterium]
MIAIGCVLNLTSRQVLGFQVAPRDSDPEIIRRLALYQTLTAERTPGVLVPGGLVWHLPRAVVPDTELAPATRRQLEQLDIFALRPRQLINETTSALYEDWAADLRRYPSLWLPHFRRVFDNYLDNPLRAVNLLNRESARINRAGVIELGHSRFVHPLLAYWPDTPVTIRCSPDDETLIWVYIGDNILCEARPAA